MTKPLVSIIIPVYNRVDLIGETLASVKQQTYDFWECIIVDDGSTDATNSIVKQYCDVDTRFKLFKRPKDRSKGGNAARNYGFEKSQGSLINWFDSDDLMSKDFLEFKINHLMPNHHFIITSGVYVNMKGKFLKGFKFDSKDFLYKRYAMYKSVIITGNVLFRRSFLEDKELFNEGVFRLQENEFFTRLFYKIKENNYLHLEYRCLLYRQHDESITNKDSVYNKSFKSSLAYNYSANLGRCFVLKDDDLVNYYYKLLVKLFFDSLREGHKSNCKFIVSHWNHDGPKINIFILRAYFIFKVCLFFGKSSYRLKQYLLKQVITL